MKIPKPLYFFEEISLRTEEERANYLSYMRKEIDKLAFTGNNEKTILKGKSFYGETFSLGLNDGDLSVVPKQKGVSKISIKKSNFISSIQAQIRAGIKENILLGFGINLVHLEIVMQLFGADIIIENNERGLIFSDKDNWFFFYAKEVEKSLDFEFNFFHQNRASLILFQNIEKLLTDEFIIQAKNNTLRFERLQDFYSGAFSILLEDGTYEKQGDHLYWINSDISYPYTDRFYLKKLSKPTKRQIKLAEGMIFKIENYISIPKLQDKEKNFISNSGLTFVGKTTSKYLVYEKAYNIE